MHIGRYLNKCYSSCDLPPERIGRVYPMVGNKHGATPLANDALFSANLERVNFLRWRKIKGGQFGLKRWSLG